MTYYEATVERPSFAGAMPPRARVAVVGGGYAGLATALGLAERGVDGIVLLEAERVGAGASGRNGGFVFAGYSLGEAELLRRLGAERARALYARTRAAVALIGTRLRRYAIAAEQVEAGVLWVNWFRDPERLRRRQRLLAEVYGVHWPELDRAALAAYVRSARYHGALLEREGFHLHPLKYAVGLARAAEGLGVTLRERQRVLRLQRVATGWRLMLDRGVLDAEQVVLACGGYLGRLEPRLARAKLPIATYVMVTEPLGERLAEVLPGRAAIYDNRFAFDYYRALPDRRLLWGGRIAIRDRAPAQVARLLVRDLARVHPTLAGVAIDYAWSGWMSYARHEMPQLGRLEPGLWYAQSFGGHGLAPTTVAGEALAAAIAEGEEGWRDFAPFGLDWTGGALGSLAAQARYWQLQARDWWDERCGR